MPKHRTEYPLAAETALKSTYMDDSMDSVADDQQGIELHKQLSQLWKRAGMQARKWLSNSPVVLSEIPPEDRASEIDLKEGSLPSIKTLGILWQAAKDAFTFKVQPPDNHFSFTKRTFYQKWQLCSIHSGSSHRLSSEPKSCYKTFGLRD